MKTRGLATVVLGIWLGGSLAVGLVVAYGFAGIDDLLARNPALAEHAGFDVTDVNAKKTSLIWVHTSELNRVYFEAWNQAQLLLGLLTLGLIVRAGKLPILLVAIATGLVAYVHFVIEPQVIELGRQLDFVPREPPPAIYTEFQQHHKTYFAIEMTRFMLVVIATAWLLWRPPKQPRGLKEFG